MWRNIEQSNDPNHHLFERLRLTLTVEQILFAWYLYNRGGVCNAETVKLFHQIRSKESIYRRLHRLHDAAVLTPLFDASYYTARKQAQLYRLSNSFLKLIDRRDSSIRRIRRLDQAISALAHAHFFLTAPYRSWGLINRDQRALYLTDRHHLANDDLPRYWVGPHDQSETVVSVNREIAVDVDGRTWAVFHPQGSASLQVEFERHFLEKWKDVFSNSDINALALAPTESAHTYLEGFSLPEPLPESPNKDRIARMLAIAHGGTGTQLRRATLHGIQRNDFEISVVHFPDAMEGYTS